jgi:Filamentous haemagglutinin family outer membrane protein
LPPHIVYYGGGNLRVNAGGDLVSSDFLVGRGTGQIQVGGSVVLDPSISVPTLLTSPQGTKAFLPLLLAVQDGFVSITAEGAITVGGIYDPAALPTNAETLTASSALPADDARTFASTFTSYGPDSGVSLLSLSGDVSALTVPSTRSLFLHRDGTLAAAAPGLLLPATLALTALSGNIAVNTALPSSDGNPANLVPYPNQTGDDTATLSLVAAGSIDLGHGLSMPDLSTSTQQFIGNRGLNDLSNYISPLGIPLANLTVALHANDPTPVVIAAGLDIYAADPATGQTATVTLIKPAEIEAGRNIYAGLAPGNLLATPGNGMTTFGLSFTGQNNNPTDVTSIVAGNDFVGGSYGLYGPGTFLLQAGHDLGPFTPSVQPLVGSSLSPGADGIAALGNGTAAGSFHTAGARLYLPAQSAEVDLLFGVKPGVNFTAVIAAFGDPSAANGMGFEAGAVSKLDALADQLILQQELRMVAAGVRSSTAGDLTKAFQNMSAAQIDQVLARLAVAAGFIDPTTHQPLVFNVTAADIQKLRQVPSEARLDQQILGLIVARAAAAGITNTVNLSPGDAVALYRAMSSLQINQELDALAPRAGLTNLSFDMTERDLPSLHLMQQEAQVTVERNFNDFLTAVGKDAKNPASTNYGQYARAYQAIATLFPAALGYTDDAAGASGGNGAAAMIKTGNLNLAASVLETQMGGDINILGPGGGITVGHTTRDALAPNLEGILTLAGGSIRAVADGSILLNQSRIMTEQGGDVDLFTANGDINAGSGPKSYVSSPTLSEICDANGFCYINPQGLVTGAGIGALTTLPGQEKSKSNANLFAPHGTIDAGSAGIRVAGQLTLGALQILNAYNIQSQNPVIGLPTNAGPPVAALTSANNTAGSAVKTAAPAADNSNRPSIIIVEFLGFGGGGEENSTPPDSPRDKPRERNSYDYDPTAPVRYVGAGPLSEEQRQVLLARSRSER